MQSWKLTAVFAALLIVAAAAYFMSSPPPAATPGPVETRVIPDLAAAQVSKLEISRKGGGLVSLERRKDKVGDYWRMTQPGDGAADGDLVEQLLYSLDRYLRAGALQPGRPETAPEVTGLADPRLTVVYHASARRETMRFGKAPPTNTGAVFCQREGDPAIYLVGVETFDFFNRPAGEYRSKSLLRFPAGMAMKLELEYKFIVKRGNEPSRVEYERSVMERIDREWWLVEPHRELLDSSKVQILIADLVKLETRDVQPVGNPAEKELHEPQAKLKLTLEGEEPPVSIHFGGAGAGGRWVAIPGSGEAAVAEAAAVDALALQRKLLRSDSIFPFTKEQVTTLSVEAGSLGKMKIRRTEIEKPGDPVSEVKWEILEPAGLGASSETIDSFVGLVLAQRILDFYGAQDFKLCRLEPPDVKLAIETKDGKSHLFRLGLATEGFLAREGIDEVFTVRPELVRNLQRLELGFMKPEMFNIPRDKLRAFSFEARGVPALLYRMALDPTTGKWRFTDPVHEKETPDDARVGSLLAVMNYIKAEMLVSRDEAVAGKHLLDERRAPATLTILWEGGPAEGTQLYISQDQSDQPGRPLYYARFKDKPLVFQINGLFVETLKKRAPVKRD